MLDSQNTKAILLTFMSLLRKSWLFSLKNLIEKLLTGKMIIERNLCENVFLIQGNFAQDLYQIREFFLEKEIQKLGAYPRGLYNGIPPAWVPGYTLNRFFLNRVYFQLPAAKQGILYGHFAKTPESRMAAYNISLF